MDSILGIGLPELFFIAVLALIILGPERLPSTLRQIAKAWGYVRNLGTELTAQFGDEFKALEDLNPRKILNEMADEELAKDLGLKKSLSAQKKPTTSTPAKSTPAKTTPAKTTPAKTTPAKTTPAKTTPAKTTVGQTTPTDTTNSATGIEPATANNSADDSKQAIQDKPPSADVNASSTVAKKDAEAEKKILPPSSPDAAPEAPKISSANGDEAPDKASVEKQPIVSATPVNINGAAEPAERAE